MFLLLLFSGLSLSYHDSVLSNFFSNSLRFGFFPKRKTNYLVYYFGFSRKNPRRFCELKRAMVVFVSLSPRLLYVWYVDTGNLTYATATTILSCSSSFFLTYYHHFRYPFLPGVFFCTLPGFFLSRPLMITERCCEEELGISGPLRCF